jgi:hypothetical protein
MPLVILQYLYSLQIKGDSQKKLVMPSPDATESVFSKPQKARIIDAKMQDHGNVGDIVP